MDIFFTKFPSTMSVYRRLIQNVIVIEEIHSIM